MADMEYVELDQGMSQVLAALTEKYGEPINSEVEGLIHCLTNELAFKRQTLTHSFDVSGVFTTTMDLVRGVTDDATVQRLVVAGLLEHFMDRFLEKVNEQAFSDLLKAEAA